MNSYELIFVVKEVSEAKEDELLALGVNLLTLGALQEAHLYVEASSVAEAVTIGFQTLVGQGIQVERLQLDLVSQSEIARRVGKERQSVSKWAQRGKKGVAFPVPFRATDLGKVEWEWVLVNDWLRQTGTEGYDDACVLNWEQVHSGNERLRSLREEVEYLVIRSSDTARMVAPPTGLEPVTL